MSRKIKTFDCVEMKRRIQEQIYEETKNMTHEGLLEYFHKRISNSQFASLYTSMNGRFGKLSVMTHANRLSLVSRVLRFESDVP